MKKVFLLLITTLMLASFQPTSIHAQSTQTEDVEIIHTNDTMYLGKKIIRESQKKRAIKPNIFTHSTFQPLKIPEFMIHGSFSQVVDTLVSTVFLISGGVIFFSLVHATLLYIEADGDRKKADLAKQKLATVAIGTIIIISGISVQQITFRLLNDNSLFLRSSTEKTKLANEEFVGSL